jgi:hypothetical protein
VGAQGQLSYRPAAPGVRYVKTASPPRYTQALAADEATPTPGESGTSKLPEAAEEDEGPSREQEKPEVQAGFLREARAVLIGQGQFEMLPAVSFRHTNRNELLLRGIDIIENIFIGNIEVGRIKRSVVNASTSFRYGLTDRVQLSLRIPYQRAARQQLLEPEVQRQLGEPTEFKTTSGGLGDIEGGMSVHALRESRWIPDLILTASLKSDSGRSPFETDDGELSTGTGFWGLRGGATFVKVSDPAVLFLNGGYFYHHEKDRINGFRKVDPPDSYDFGVGFSYALNPFLSLTTRFSSTFTEKTEINGLEIDGSDQVQASLSFGVTYALGARTSVDIGADIGLTDDSPDFAVRVSTPMVFRVPSFAERWKPSWFSRF